MFIQIKTIFKNELLHIVAGLLAAAVIYFFYNSIILFFITFLISLVVDIDHLLEYFLAEGFRFNNFFKKLLSGETFEKIEKIYVVFHAWEYLFILIFLFLITNNPIYFAIFLGLLVHYIIDTLSNDVVLVAYFLTYRIVVKFNLYKIGTRHLKNNEKKF